MRRYQPAADDRRRAAVAHPVERRRRDRILRRRRGVTTLPTKIYSTIEVAVTPEVDAAVALLMALTMIMVAARIAPEAMRARC